MTSNRLIAFTLMLLMAILPCCAFAETAKKDPRPYMKEELVCERDGLRINGVIYKPKNTDENIPVVICSHGFNGFNQAMQTYAAALVKAGYAGVCFDFCGGGTACKSDGEITDMSIFTEEADLTAVLDAVKNLDWVDADRVYLLGVSQGGMVSAMVAADHAEEVDGLVLIYPAFSIAEDAQERFAAVEEIPETLELMGVTVGRAYYENLLDYDAWADVTRYSSPVLIFHGTADTTVNYSWSQEAARQYPNAELITVEGAGHGFTGTDHENTIARIIEYLNNRK